MSEQELKLHVPAHARAGVKKAICRLKHQSIWLKAMYFDTADRELAKANIALRLRLEGDRWVQTLKMPSGDHALSRLELNHARNEPILDLSVYADTPAQHALSKLKSPLVLRYETIIQRFFRKQRMQGSVVELAYDTGIIRSGTLELPVSEIEFELVSGQTKAIFDVGRKWLHDFNLLLDLRTKSQRGDQLANSAHTLSLAQDPVVMQAYEIDRFWAPRNQAPFALSPDFTATQALKSISQECLEQMVVNASFMAEIDTHGFICIANQEHLHQLRVGMRRLLSAWSLFKGFATLPSSEFQSQLKVFLRQFGASRDRDVMLESILPELVAAGMPAFTLEHHAQVMSDSHLATQDDFQSWLLNLLQWIVLTPNQDPKKELPEPEVPQTPTPIENTGNITLNVIPLVVKEKTQPTLQKCLEARISKWNRQIVRHWQTHDKTNIEHYHDLRKKIKQMRYALAVYQSLVKNNRLKPYLKQLVEAQKVFGTLNDYASAYVFFDSIKEAHPQALFALGWLASKIEVGKRLADEAIKHIPKKIKF